MEQKYEIEINRINDNGNMIKGFVTIKVDEYFQLCNIIIAQGKEQDKLYVLFPNYKTGEMDEYNNPTYQEYFSPFREFRDELIENILQAFRNDEKKVMIQSEEPIKVTANVAILNKGEQLAKASIYMDEKWVIHGIELKESADNSQRYITMPTIKTNEYDNGKEVYKEMFYPITDEFKDKLTQLISHAYNKVLEQEIEIPLEEVR